MVQKVRVAALRDLVSAERYAKSTCCLFLAVVESTSLNPVAGVGGRVLGVLVDTNNISEKLVCVLVVKLL